MFKVLLVVLLALGLCVGAMAAPGISDLAVKTASVISLDGPDWEFSSLAVATPKIVGVGGTLSYKFVSSKDNAHDVWLDAGLLKYNEETNFLAGASTNMPFGGKTLTSNTRVGIWYLFDADAVVTGVRVPF